MGKSLCLLNLFPSIAAKQECACPSEALPRVGRGLTAGNAHSIQLDKTEPGHLLVPGPVLDTRTQPWASPGVCPSRGETDESASCKGKETEGMLPAISSPKSTAV